MKENIITKNDIFKRKEKQYETQIPNDNYLIVRLDGHKFSKFTKGLKKPYDELLSKVMIRTMKDLIEKFTAYLGYTGSDEITLYFPNCNANQNHIFNGRIQKIASILAAYATLKFNYWFDLAIKDFEEYIHDTSKYKISEVSNEDYNYLKNLYNKQFIAFFDARVYGLESKKEVFEHFKWRNHDVFRNAKTGFAQAYCSHKELQNLSANEQIKLVYEKKGKSFGESPEWYKYGTFAKKELYMKETENGLVKRSKIRTWNELLENYKLELFDKYINENEFE